MFAFLFGLSMDYEVFILSRMREAYDEHGDTDRAVVDGLGATGRLVTSAALILFLAFVALGAAPGTELKIFATGLAAGIILDATIVRALIVPGPRHPVRQRQLVAAGAARAAVAAEAGDRASLRHRKFRPQRTFVRICTCRDSPPSSARPLPSRFPRRRAPLPASCPPRPG